MLTTNLLCVIWESYHRLRIAYEAFRVENNYKDRKNKLWFLNRSHGFCWGLCVLLELFTSNLNTESLRVYGT